MQNELLESVIEGQKALISYLIKRRGGIEGRMKIKEKDVPKVRGKLASALEKFKAAKLKYDQRSPKDDEEKLKSNYKATEKVAMDVIWDISMEEGHLGVLKMELKEFDKNISSELYSMKSLMNTLESL